LIELELKKLDAEANMQKLAMLAQAGELTPKLAEEVAVDVVDAMGKDSDQFRIDLREEQAQKQAAAQQQAQAEQSALAQKTAGQPA
jgi:hypothetical protein